MLDSIGVFDRTLGFLVFSWGMKWEHWQETHAYQGVRNVSFAENFAYVLNE